MIQAVSDNELAEVKRLIGKGCAVNTPDYDGRTPLHIAASNNNIDIVRQLLKVNDIKVNFLDTFFMTPYHDAMINHHKEVGELRKQNHGVIVHRDLGYKLCQAGFKGDLATLKNLKQHGAIVDTADYDLRTALHLAACEGHVEVVQWLLQQNADTSVKDCFMNTAIDDA